MFKVGDRVISPKGKGIIVCIGNRITDSLCVEHYNSHSIFHDGNPVHTGFKGKAGKCFWFKEVMLLSDKPAFKGNAK